MDRRPAFLSVLLVLAVCLGSGCASSSRTAAPRAYRGTGPENLTPDTVNAMTNAFADDHVVRMSEARDGLMAESQDLEDRIRQNRFQLKDAASVFEIASSSNPNAGMIDMVVMISLQEEAIRRGAIDRTLTPDQRRRPESYDIDDEELERLLTREDRVLLAAYRASKREVKALAERVFYPEQITQLERLIDEWWVSNPERRFVSHVRLGDFTDYRGATVETLSGGARNLLGLFYLDPFASMDPTTREIAQARMLADRLAFQFVRFPLLVFLYTRGVLYEALALEDVVAVRSTFESTEASLARFADVADRWPQEVAAERKAAIADLEAAVARQRDELLRAIDERAEPLQGTLAQLDATLQTATGLSDSITQTVRSVDDLTAGMAERSSGEAPTDIADVQRLADSAVEGVGGLERSLGAVERLLAPEPVDDESRSRVDRSLTLATENTRALVDYVFWRGVLLAVIVLVGWVIAVTVARLLAARIGGRPRGDR